MTRRIQGNLLFLVLISIASTACSPGKYVDTDNSCNTPRELPPGNVIPDELNVPKGDKADCKRIRFFRDATVVVTYRVGNAFDKHSIRGAITLYNNQAQVMDTKIVDPRQEGNVYEIEFPIKAKQEAFVLFTATEGRAGYTAQVSFKRDPCSACTATQNCIDGQCRDKDSCDPPCDPDSEICENNQCLFACGAPCTRGKSCNVETRQCERNLKRCSPRCRSGYYCDTRRGRCKKRAATKCSPACAKGSSCRNGRCIAGGPKCPASCPPKTKCDSSTGYKCVSTVPSQGPITGQIVTINRAGQYTTIYINRGKRNDVKVGFSGKACGRHKFRITSALPYRSRATVKATIEEIGTCKSVVIYRK